jgi:hypothetical protein
MIALSACGGNPNAATASGTFNLQAGYVNLVNMGLTTNVALSGTVIVNGNSTPFTGTGTLLLVYLGHRSDLVRHFVGDGSVS